MEDIAPEGQNKILQQKHPSAGPHQSFQYLQLNCKQLTTSIAKPKNVSPNRLQRTKLSPASKTSPVWHAAVEFPIIHSRSTGGQKMIKSGQPRVGAPEGTTTNSSNRKRLKQGNLQEENQRASNTNTVIEKANFA